MSVHARLIEDKESIKRRQKTISKFGIDFFPLISKEKLKYDQTLILLAGIIKSLIPLKKRNKAN